MLFGRMLKKTWQNGLFLKIQETVFLKQNDSTKQISLTILLLFLCCLVFCILTFVLAHIHFLELEHWVNDIVICICLNKNNILYIKTLETYARYEELVSNIQILTMKGFNITCVLAEVSKKIIFIFHHYSISNEMV